MNGRSNIVDRARASVLVSLWARACGAWVWLRARDHPGGSGRSSTSPERDCANRASISLNRFPEDAISLATLFAETFCFCYTWCDPWYKIGIQGNFFWERTGLHPSLQGAWPTCPEGSERSISKFQQKPVQVSQDSGKLPHQLLRIVISVNFGEPKYYCASSCPLTCWAKPVTIDDRHVKWPSPCPAPVEVLSLPDMPWANTCVPRKWILQDEVSSRGVKMYSPSTLQHGL